MIKTREVEQKVTFGTSTNYESPQLTLQFIEDNAHLLNISEMAKMFKISRTTFYDRPEMKEAHEIGLMKHLKKRRKQLEDLIDRLAQGPDYDHCHRDAKTNEFLKAHAMFTARYDTPTETVHTEQQPIQYKVTPPVFETSTTLTASERAELEGTEENDDQ